MNPALLWDLALVAASFITGTLAGGIARLFRKRSTNPAVTLRRKGSSETVTIPAHYDTKLVDDLLHKLKTA